MHFVLDENNNKVEAYDKEEVLAVLNQAIADGTLANLVADAAFVTKLKCCVTGQTNRIAFVTQAKYNEMAAAGLTENGVYYYIIDDNTLDGINTVLTELTEKIIGVETSLDDYKQALDTGSIVVKKAKDAEWAKDANSAYSAMQANSALTAGKAGSLNTTALLPNSAGNIEVTATGVYVVVMKNTNGNMFSTAVIAIPDLSVDSTSTVFVSPYIHYTASNSCLVVTSTTSATYALHSAYKII